MNNHHGHHAREEAVFDPSWIPVFIMLFVAWPIGLIMLYNKIKRAEGAEQRKRKSISWMSAGLCAVGAAFVFGSGRMFGLFALLGGAAVFGYSRKMKASEGKFQKYANVIGGRPLVPISAIAAAMPCGFDEAKADLQRMIDDGYFGPHAYIDSGKDWFVADSRQALSHLDALTKKFEQRRAGEAPAQQHAEPAAEDEYGQNLVRIRALNDAISDEAVSAKIERIEAVTINIFALVKQSPDKRGEIRTFMNYYLPTTLKLLESYSVLEKQSVQGQNIASTKANIEKMLEQLVWAFERQLDQMFEAEARDIGTDITVLERMMVRDGLTENPYSFPKPPAGGTGAAQQQQQRPS